MRENYLITIEGFMNMGDDTDSVSLTTLGSFYKKNGKYYIIYKETEATGYRGCTTTLKTWDGGVSMTRLGRGANSNLIIEKGTINLCNYQTVAGPIMLDITGVEIENRLHDNGGELCFEYSLSSNGMLISDNKVNVTVKEIEQQ